MEKWDDRVALSSGVDQRMFYAEASLCSGKGEPKVTDLGEAEKLMQSLVNKHFVLVVRRHWPLRAKSGNLEGGKCWFPGLPSSKLCPPQGQGSASWIVLPCLVLGLIECLVSVC